MDVMGIFKGLENHPVVKQIVGDEAARLLKERQGIAANLEKARQKAEAVLPGFQAKVDAAMTDLKAGYDKLQGLTLKAAEARSALCSKQLEIDREISDAEAALRESCDPRIDEAIRFFWDQGEILKRNPIHRGDEFTGYGPMGEMWSAILNNWDAVLSAINHCRAMTRELEEMKLLPAVDLERIEEMKKIPDPNQMKKTGGQGKKAPLLSRSEQSRIE
ncbi:hypothetical protein C4565_04940 [Candidatus Parcubacteria bacterium]|nr:MAG: hypothetical protein C4565_04940 [Candidatus Parcubacteria bacterium]